MSVPVFCSGRTHPVGPGGQDSDEGFWPSSYEVTPAPDRARQYRRRRQPTNPTQDSPTKASVRASVKGRVKPTGTTRHHPHCQGSSEARSAKPTASAALDAGGAARKIRRPPPPSSLVKPPKGPVNKITTRGPPPYPSYRAAPTKPDQAHAPKGHSLAPELKDHEGQRQPGDPNPPSDPISDPPPHRRPVNQPQRRQQPSSDNDIRPKGQQPIRLSKSRSQRDNGHDGQHQAGRRHSQPGQPRHGLGRSRRWHGNRRDNGLGTRQRVHINHRHTQRSRHSSCQLQSPARDHRPGCGTGLSTRHSGRHLRPLVQGVRQLSTQLVRLHTRPRRRHQLSALPAGQQPHPRHRHAPKLPTRAERVEGDRAGCRHIE